MIIYLHGFRSGPQSWKSRSLKARLDALGLADLKSLRGRLSRRMSDKPEAWGRAQYVQALTGMS